MIKKISHYVLFTPNFLGIGVYYSQHFLRVRIETLDVADPKTMTFYSAVNREMAKSLTSQSENKLQRAERLKLV